jgi:spermidine synthase
MILVFSLTILLNAGLLFLIQPLVAKMLLPWLGGSPAVWNTSLVFYQACLLAGYGYAHLGSSWLGIRRHALIHLILMISTLLLLPINLPLRWFATPSDNPVGLLLAVLTVTIGFPFFVLSAGAPLIQKWFAGSDHRAAGDPYFLYAASNAGSITGLLVYPLAMERWLTLNQQSYVWFCAYLNLLVLISIGVLLFLQPLDVFAERPLQMRATEESPATREEIGSARRLRWIVWSFVPSSLLLGVTSYVTADIVSMPLLWVLPLVAYLLSFVIAFARPSWATSSFLVRRQAFLLLGAAITVFMHANEPVWIVLPLHLIAFVATAIVCHGQLAKDRPDAKNLTDFYFWISVGGVLGGAFNALIAPVVFKIVIEYPLALAAAAFLRPYVGERIDTTVQRWLDWLLLPAVVSAALVVNLLLKQSQLLLNSNEHLVYFAMSGIFCLSCSARPVRFGVGLAVMTVISLWYPSPLGRTLYTDRSFFGAYRVTLDPEGKKHLLFQGTTIHGAQSVAPKMRQVPMTYYHRTGPAGQVLLDQPKVHSVARVAVVGLGAGALACHGTPVQHFTFYEIDPLVEKIARDEKLFTYLHDCPPKIDVVIGDARISLAKAPDHLYDIFVLDAFSSDVIPTHLLTREAVKLYFAKTAEDGVVLFHISNRFLDLAPVLDRLAANLKLVALIQDDFNLGPQELLEGKSSSRWVLLACDEQAVEHFLKDPRWQRLNGRLKGDLWTDEYSDILRLISWP